MATIIHSPLVKWRLNDLFEALYNKGYFGFKENARSYVNGIINFMYSIPDQKRYRTKRNKYGSFYCRYKPNRLVKTTYYITFDTDGKTYLVKKIISSHTREYPIYILGD